MDSSTILNLAVAFGVAVVANLALRSLEIAGVADNMRRRVLRLAPLCAVAVCVSVFTARSWWATVLVIPWLGAALSLFLSTAWSEARPPRLRWVGIINVVACAYLVVGATFLLIWRIGGHPSGLSDTIVELTAIHYHFAGFAALVLASRCVSAIQSARVGMVAARGSATLVMVASPLIAVGFVVNVHFLALGAVVMVVGIVGIAAVSFLQVAPAMGNKRARTLLRVSAASVLISMALALDYGLGQVLPIRTLSIDQMVVTHGLINAVLFTGCGLLAWVIADRSQCGA